MKAVVFTLGCKVNQYEGQAVAKKLAEFGYSASTALSKADLYVINTCSVTAEADKKSRQAVARALKFNPNGRVIILGCSSQNDFKAFMDKPNVIAIGGSGAKIQTIEQALKWLGARSGTGLEKTLEQKKESEQKESPLYDFGLASSALPNLVDNSTIFVSTLPARYEDDLAPEPDKTRGLIKIQDGCNRFCSYCRVPYLRGRSRSRPLESVINEAARISANCHEIVLTGVDISAYGKDIGLSLTSLVKALKGGPRKRLGSLECGIIDESLLESMMDCGFCDHFHLSLQSGSDTVLRRMNRHYTAAEYLRKVEMILQFFPFAGITTDIISGFPGETDDEHAQTARFIQEAAFSDIHVFPYSRRAGTKAYSMPQTDAAAKTARTQELLKIKQELKTDFLNKNLGRVSEVYVEEKGKSFNTGFTSNYIKVYTKAVPQSLIRQRLVKIHEQGVVGEDE